LTVIKDKEILKKLDEWEGNEGSLPQSLEFYRRLLQIQLDTRERFKSPQISLSKEDIEKHLMSGLPLLQFKDIAFDWPLLQKTIIKIAKVYAGYSNTLKTLPEKLKEKVSDIETLKDIVEVWLTKGKITSKMTVRGINKAIIESILHASIRPFFISYSEAVINMVNQDHWRRRYCPVCGGNADFASLKKDVGERWLLCSRCDAEWLYQRLACPYCSTEEQKSLSYRTDEKELYRLYLCDNCKQYLKVIDLRKTEDEVLLPLERFLTLDLDNQAQEEGFSPGIPVRSKRQVKSNS